ncbi:hypothetical protein Anas_03691 [Armadillidium nasatum]|uniref:E3 ubiquitin-protein ligase APD1-4 N-terminal domain-containing protein n=1 Tax=Armadillidium nasatum TaxID=96803 RepID=A0A5N5SRY4_9CRUS|nr:hypothetical protein Anas_03691 [Armadillidium nasatum]
MLQHVVLKDDVKEYWGFFLQKGSIVNINLCTRHDGGMLMIMRGVNNLKKCAWIGQEDSAEQDEDHKETSDESGQRTVFHDFPMASGELFMETERDRSIFSKLNNTRIVERNLTSEERKEELEFYIKKVIKLSKNRKEILKGLKKHKLNLKDKILDKEIKEMDLNEGSKPTFTVEAKRKKKNSNIFPSINERLERVRRSLTEGEENEGGEIGLIDEQKAFRKSIYLNADNSSYEVSNATKELYLSLLELPKNLQYERGSINQSHNHDMSHEEHRSSFSSSEEALTKCEGLIGLLPLYPSRRCQKVSDSHTNKIKYKIPVTGTYFFVFSSDNELMGVDIEDYCLQRT